MLVQVGRRYVSEQREIDPLFAKGMKELLARSKVFHDCHDEFIRDLIVSSNRKEFGLNRYLMEEGSRGDSMFVLYKGVVEVTSGGRYVCKLQDGSIVGEAALLNLDNRRTASVRSVQKCDVAIIFRSTFHSILEKYPWEKKKFQREMKAKLMELGKFIDVKDDINLEQQAIQCDALKKVPFFALNESLHDFVAELAMNASSYWYRPGRVIVQEGDTRCDEMYVLLQGAVEITACGEFLGRLENDLFGEICVLDLLDRRTANVVAVTQCHCMMFSRQVVIPVLAKYPEARMLLLEHARQRLVALNRAIGSGPGAVGGGAAAAQGPGNRALGCAIGFGSVLSTADAQLFSASPLFRDARVDFLRELSVWMSTRKVEGEKTIIEEGQPCSADKDYIYWIDRGQAEVWKGNHFMCLLDAGDVFGELSAQDGYVRGRREASVKSRTKMTLRQVQASKLHELMRQYQDKAFVEKFHSEVEKRRAQIAKKTLDAQKNVKLVDIDFMFMKLPHTSPGGQSVPKHESLAEALEGEGFGLTLKAPPLAFALPSITRPMSLSAR